MSFTDCIQVRWFERTVCFIPLLLVCYMSVINEHDMQFINLAHAILSSIIYNMLSYGLPPVNVQMLNEKKGKKKKKRRRRRRRKKKKRRKRTRRTRRKEKKKKEEEKEEEEEEEEEEEKKKKKRERKEKEKKKKKRRKRLEEFSHNITVRGWIKTSNILLCGSLFSR